MAEWFQLTPSKDGKRRLTLKIEYSLTLEDIAAAIVYRHNQSEVVTDWAAWAQRYIFSRAEAVKMVKASLEHESLDTIYCRIGDNELWPSVELVEERLEKLW